MCLGAGGLWCVGLVTGETTDFGLTALFCVVWAAVGDSYKEKENNQKEVWPNLQYLTLLGISSPFCNLN